MYADRMDRHRFDNGPDRQKERDSARVRAAFDVLVDRVGGQTREHGFDLRQPIFRRHWRR